MSEAVEKAEVVMLSELPGPKGAWLTGSLGEFRADILGMVERCFKDYGDRVRVRLLHQQALLIFHPDDLYTVLIGNHRNYEKRTKGYKGMRMLLGNGLVTSQGEFWLRQRRIAQPAFHKKRIRGFGETMADAAARKVESWRTKAQGGVLEVDMAEEMMEVALDIVGRTLLSTDLVGTASAVSPALEFVMRDLLRRVQNPLALPLKVPTPHNLKVRGAIKTMDEVVEGIIKERRAGGEMPEDLLTMLMEAEDEDTGERMSDEQLRDEVMTVFLAGHETTATALTWTLYLLSEHREAREKLVEEVDRVLGGRRPTMEDLKELKWTKMVLEESMRLYPPVPLLARMSEEESVIEATEELPALKVPKDTFVLFSPYVTHRHPAYWDDPEAFRPERFAEKSDRPRMAYYPFLGGPRQCIGNSFAMMEAQMVLATVMSHFEFERCSDEPVGLDVTITVRPEGGMPMRLKARDL